MLVIFPTTALEIGAGVVEAVSDEIDEQTDELQEPKQRRKEVDVPPVKCLLKMRKVLKQNPRILRDEDIADLSPN